MVLGRCDSLRQSVHKARFEPKRPSVGTLALLALNEDEGLRASATSGLGVIAQGGKQQLEHIQAF
jgi:hypothetical protein